MSKHRIVGVALIGLAICLLLIKLTIWIWILLPFYLGCIVVGSFSIQSNYFLKSVNTIPNQEEMIFLTFDDGPSPYTIEVLEVLAKWNAKASFFCIGSAIAKYPEILHKIVQEGHLIGNHTFSHSNTFPIFSVSRIKSDIQLATDLIEKETGQKPIFFRPPFGVTNPRIAKVLKDLNLQSVGWNKRSLDTVSKNKESILKRVTKNLKPGDIILLHDNLPGTAGILNQFLAETKSQGFYSQRIDKLIKT